MKKMRLADIKISKGFANTVPNQEKLHKCYQHWIETHKQDRDIVINHKGYLVDGYVQYIILMELGEEYADVVIGKKKDRNYEKVQNINQKPTYMKTPTIYISGSHKNNKSNKEYTWRVPPTWGDWADDLQIGDVILCNTKYGMKSIIVNKIEVLDKPPIDLPIKKVLKRKIIRDGVEV